MANGTDIGLIARASWIIERNLASPLTLATLADACGVSRFHLAHAFGRATGRSVMTHVRARRLSEAARSLATGAAPRVTDVAFDTGYASHEAFTRSFRDAFGITPSNLRKSRAIDRLALTGPLASRPLDKGDIPMLTPRFETVTDAWVFVGLAAATDFQKLTEEIPGQWARFMSRIGEIADIADDSPWGLSRGTDADGRLDYMCAARVRDAKGAVPEGLERTRVPPRTYAVFHHAAHVAKLGATYEAIWTGWLPDRGRVFAESPILERHTEAFDPLTGEGGVDIWMPVRGTR